MFWRFGGYANISTIDTILDKPDFELEDLLDESDLIQELKQHNTKLIEYLREDKVLGKLLDYVVAPKLEPVETPTEDDDGDRKGKTRASPGGRSRASSHATNNDDNEDDELEKRRNRYAFVAAEVLSSDNWSIYEALMENQPLLRSFWNFLKHPAPLDPLQASYFTKVNESLFDKKTDEMVDLLKSLDNAIADILRHVDCPMIMDLLLKIISLERTDSGQGVVEWLYTKDVMPTLLSFLAPEHSWAIQTSAGDFIKAIITVSANASQNEQACIGPNELTRQLVSRPCVEKLVGYMLRGGNPLTVGVGIIIEVIRKNNSDYDPDVGADSSTMPSSRDPIYLGTLLRLFAENVPKFMHLILNAPAQQQRLGSTFGDNIEPLGFDRFKTCELMAELLHCSNMALLNEDGSEQAIALRDAERQRLRTEGKLMVTRGEEGQSSEDLTMRMHHSSPEDSRRLEVTNASDDDGFEEVASSGEMTEDTSHEFVKAEEEIRAGPSFLEKDAGDFVDEPLGSPRLTIPQGQADEQQFENPELVVAPLSPKKPPSVSSGVASAKPSQISGSDADETSSQSAQEPAGESVRSAGPDASGGAAGPDDESSEPTGGEPVASSSPRVQTDSSVENAPQAAHSETVEPGTTANLGVQADAETQQSGTTPEPAKESVEPVVGDFLKIQFVDHKVVPTILSFFFKYPWNNFLHNVVYDIVQQVFNGPMDRGYNARLAISLFESADVTRAIIDGQAVSEKSQAENKTRMGYMGHLTLIAEEVVKFTERNPPELLSQLVLDRVLSPEWISYVEGALAETRERDNAILGGVRPEVAMSNRNQMSNNGLGGMGLSSLGLGGGQGGGGSNALAEAGLTGGSNSTGNNAEMQDNGSGSSLGPFSISSGLLSGSGFGSSSDEEDDDGDDNDDDVNNEFRSYTDPLNASSTSMEPPSIPPPPPPPPPLNIPPSRARLQLAARLAAQQKSNSDFSGPSSENVDHDDDDDPRNPFDDDGEDDSGDDSDDDGVGGTGGGRGAWWRSTLGRRDSEKFGDGRDDSDSDKEDGGGGRGDDEDEEFGDFAMPEVEKEGEGSGVVVKPLPMHPPSQSQKSSTFTSLWPFGSKDKEKQKGKDDEGGLERPPDITGEDGEKIRSTQEAKGRTSIEEADDEEVVV